MTFAKWIGAAILPLWLAAGALAQSPGAATASAPEAEAAPAPYTGPTVYLATVKARYPHDPEAFTQGLLWHDGVLYESTGRVGKSSVRKIELETGKVLMDRPIPAEQFGEGLALWGDQLVSLTWQDKSVHRWQLGDLTPVSSIDDFPFDGWGLTTSDEGLIHSDGSSTLRVLDPETYDVIRSVEVTLNGRPLTQINELEMIDGVVFANIWQTPFIALIDPATGVVRGLIDCRAIVAETPVSDYGAVLNGIAWDAERQRLFITGKLWPFLYEIDLAETDAQVR